MALLLLLVLLVPSAAIGQIVCFRYSNMLSCDSPSGNTIIAPLTPSQGIVTQRGYGTSSLEPYTVITPVQPRHRSRPHDLDLEPLAPLPSLLGPPPAPGLELPSLDLPSLELP